MTAAIFISLNNITMNTIHMTDKDLAHYVQDYTPTTTDELRKYAADLVEYGLSEPQIGAELARQSAERIHAKAKESGNMEWALIIAPALRRLTLIEREEQFRIRSGFWRT